MPFVDLRLLLKREFAEDFAQMTTQLLIKGFASTFQNKHNMIFADPSRLAWAFILVDQWSSFRARGCTRWNSAGGLAETSNFYSHPQGPGVSRLR
jgi:hypothetical protein